jgi:C4-dicarboxylate-specific signal transduction histidine kinase
MISLDRIADLTRDGFLSVPNAVLVHPNGSLMAPGDFPAARAMTEKRVIADVEFGVRYGGSETRWFRVSAAPLPIVGYGAMVAYTETTEQKQMEERERQHEMELARVSRLNTLGEMAAALAHELGQPLASALNYLHGCQLRQRTGNFDSTLFNSAISQAIHHTERAGDIVRNVKQFVRRHEAASTPTQVNALIEQTLSVLEFDILESRATVRLDLDEDLPTTYLSPLEIQQVLINLIKNAFEAMADLPTGRRRVEVRTQASGSMVRISVADRGPGIANKDAADIFNPFFTTKPHGMGLGLAVCRSIVESHGGRMAATHNEHGGATFSFTLPINAGLVKSATLA